MLPLNLTGKNMSVAGFHIAVSIPFKTPKYLQNYIHNIVRNYENNNKFLLLIYFG